MIIKMVDFCCTENGLLAFESLWHPEGPMKGNFCLRISSSTFEDFIIF